MRSQQIQLGRIDETVAKAATLAPLAPQLVLAFGAPGYFADPAFADALAQALPGAIRVGCSSAGEITREGVHDGSCTLTALHFDGTRLREASTTLASMQDSRDAGLRLARQLADPELTSVLVLGQGIAINGSALIAGLAEGVGNDVSISGGLAGDGGAFRRTWVLSTGGAAADALVAIGFYGRKVEVAHGYFGGWEPFGPARKVTRCDGNVLYELDGEPALAIYKRYLGEYAKDLPASGLLFPFAMSDAADDNGGAIRTILGIDEAKGSLILAGEIRSDGYLKLMHAGTDALVEGSSRAARSVADLRHAGRDGVAILVSCVGRKLVMGDRVDEEIDAVCDALGDRTLVTGFYSYGEISPSLGAHDCRLHNQTMTITYLAEA